MKPISASLLVLLAAAIPGFGQVAARSDDRSAEPIQVAISRTSHPPPCGESWMWSLEAPIAAALLYAFWVWRAKEMGVWGFFFPAPIWS
jgi:hypothetical protein